MDIIVYCLDFVCSLVIHFIPLWDILVLLCHLTSTQLRMILSALVMGMVKYDTGVSTMGAVQKFSRYDLASDLLAIRIN